MATCENCFHQFICLVHTDHAPSPCSAYTDKADVVEVVRCKDCVHWETIKTLYGEDNVCKAQGCMTVAKKPDDYCSLGEREEKSAPVTAESAIREIQEAAKEYAEQLKKIGKDEDVLFRLQLGRTMDL